MKPKSKEGKIKSMYLSDEEIDILNISSNMNGFKSDSQYIGWLIRNHNLSTNPTKFLKELDKQETLLNEQLQEIKNKRSEIIKNIDVLKDIEIEKSKKRPEATRIIQRKIVEEGIIEGERLARNWAIILNCSASELLAEAIIKSRNREIKNTDDKY